MFPILKEHSCKGFQTDFPPVLKDIIFLYLSYTSRALQSHLGLLIMKQPKIFHTASRVTAASLLGRFSISICAHQMGFIPQFFLDSNWLLSHDDLLRGDHIKSLKSVDLMYPTLHFMHRLLHCSK